MTSPKSRQSANPASNSPPKKRRRGIRTLQSEIPKTTPSRRDLEVYQAAVLLGRRQEDVARQFHISPTRVRQLIRRVRLWKSTVPWQMLGLTDEQQINLATHETRDWLEAIRDRALSGDAASDQHTPRSPKCGFLAIALQATCRWGRIGGAGEQWRRLATNSTMPAASAVENVPSEQPPPSMGTCGKKNPSQISMPLASNCPATACETSHAAQVVAVRPRKKSKSLSPPPAAGG